MKVKNFFNMKVMPVIGKFANQRHMMAIRNGIVSTIPFVIIGAMALLILNFPIDSTGKTSLKNIMTADINNMFLFIFRYVLGTMGLFAAWGIGSELGKSYKMSQTTTGLLGAFGFLIFILPVGGSKMSLGEVGGSAIFLSMVASIASVEIYHLFRRFKITLKMPKGVPDAVSASFDILTPVIFIALLFGSVRYLLGFDLSQFMKDILSPLQNVLTGSFGGVIIVILFVGMFWWVGIHGTSMVEGIMRPFWQSAISKNSDWFNGGKKGSIPYDFPEQFGQWFVWIGGAGATLGLIIVALLFAKSKQLRTVSKVSSIPALFNINEPVIFGMPIMLNPILLVPFIFAPIVMAVSGWLLSMAFGVHMVLQTAWTLPAPIGAYFSSGGNVWAIIIAIINILISIVIWAPFVIIYDRKLRKDAAKISGEEFVKGKWYKLGFSFKLSKKTQKKEITAPKKVEVK